MLGDYPYIHISPDICPRPWPIISSTIAGIPNFIWEIQYPGNQGAGNGASNVYKFSYENLALSWRDRTLVMKMIIFKFERQFQRQKREKLWQV